MSEHDEWAAAAPVLSTSQRFATGVANEVAIVGGPTLSVPKSLAVSCEGCSTRIWLSPESQCVIEQRDKSKLSTTIDGHSDEENDR
jgi:hypothetical protein